MEGALSPLQVVPHDHLLQLHDVGVVELQQQGDLPQAADGHSWGQREPRCTSASSRGQGRCCLHEEPPLPWHPWSFITFFLVVHPHLLQCYGLIRYGVPGTVWKSSQALSTRRQTPALFPITGEALAPPSPLTASGPLPHSPARSAPRASTHPSAQAPSPSHAGRAASPALTHYAVGALPDAIQLLELLHAPAPPQLQPNRWSRAGAASGGGLPRAEGGTA